MADKTLQEVVSNVQSQARFFRSVLDLADAVDSIAKIDQLRAETEAALRDRRADHAGVLKDLDKAMGQVKAANLAAAQSAKNAKEIEAAANDKAAQIIASAQDGAASIVADARGRASDTDNRTAEAAKALADLQGQIAAAEKSLAGRQADYSAILAKIADAKKRIEDMMGA